MMGWLGGELNPEHLDVKEVSFDDPDKRRKFAFGCGNYGKEKQ
jgi:hypothetical protein